MIKKSTFLTIACLAFQLSYGQQKNSPFSPEVSYVADAYANAIGGLKQGVGYLGMANLALGFDTEKAGWWRGGSFFVNGASIHGRSLSEDFLGDLQVASNIDAGTHLYLHELWYRQTFGPVALTAGLQDLNAEFMVSEGAGEFVNSSFGVPPVIATGIPVPIFPLTGLGVAARWDISGKVAVQTALFDGTQTDFDDNPHNLTWSLGRGDGLLSMTEIHLNGRYKLGVYYHSVDDNYGVYLLADQPVGERTSLFGQLAVAPKGKNENNHYLGAGVNHTFGERLTAGLAMAYAGLHAADHKHETAIELYCKYALNDCITLQPDIQYILRPSGTGAKLPDACVGILRVCINL